MASDKIVKQADRRALRRPTAGASNALDRWAQMGRERAERAARIDAGLDSTLREAAAGLLWTIGDAPEVLAEGFAETHGSDAPISAFIGYASAFLGRLREMAPTGEG